MRPITVLTGIALCISASLKADDPPVHLALTDGKTAIASTIEWVPKSDSIKWEHSTGKDEKSSGSIPLNHVMSIRFPTKASKKAPVKFSRKVMAGPWQPPEKFAEAKPINTASVSRIETTQVKHENKETTAYFSGKLTLPVSGTWTLLAIAPDRLGMIIDKATVLTPETPESTAKVKLEAGERELAISVPSNKARIYEMKISGPGYSGDLANLLVNGPPMWRVTLKNGSRLSGIRGKHTTTAQTINTAAGELSLLWTEIQAFALDSAETETLTAELPSDQDILLVAAGERVVELRAKILSIDATHIRVDHNGSERKITHERVVAFQKKRVADSQTENATVRLEDGSVLHGKLAGLSKERAIRLSMGASENNPITLNAGLAEELLLRQPGCTFLSDLTPTRVDQRAWFDYPVQWRRNQGFDHQLPTSANQTFGHALALHAFTRFTLPPTTSQCRFLALVGIESGAPAAASATVRILAGDEVLAKKEALTPESGLWQIDLPLPAGLELTLEVDFGANEDIGDKIIFGDARFLAKEESK